MTNTLMATSSYGVAVSVGLAVGFAAVGMLGVAGLCILGGGLLILTQVLMLDAGTRSAAMRTFFTQPVRFEHAIVWCVALVVAALLASAWG